ncbi:MAG: hypothetical protein RIS94_2232 [Pseudomonadota bacterium]|jgi:hypothetical protein
MEQAKTALAALFAHPAAPLIAQGVLSLIAIVALVAIARGLGLGGDVRIPDEDTARALADDAVCGFGATDIALDRARIGALARNAQGRVLLIRRHGAHFVARELTSYEGIRLDRHFLTISTPDRRFGAITLDLGPEAQAWAASLRRLGATA